MYIQYNFFVTFQSQMFTLMIGRDVYLDIVVRKDWNIQD